MFAAAPKVAPIKRNRTEKVSAPATHSPSRLASTKCHVVRSWFVGAMSKKARVR